MVKFYFQTLTTDEIIIAPPLNAIGAINNTFEIDYCNELEKFINKFDFIKNRDYLMRKIDSQDLDGYKSTVLQISGKSMVLRFLSTISTVEQDLCTRNAMLQICWQSSTEITERDCLIADLKFVRMVNDQIFNFMKNEIINVHAKFTKRSSVIEVLTNNLNFIEKLENVSDFENTKYLLVFCSLTAAFADEQILNTQGKFSIFGKGPSVLLPAYALLIKEFKKRVPKIALMMDKTLLNIYKQEVLIKEIKPLPLLITTKSVSSQLVDAATQTDELLVKPTQSPNMLITVLFLSSLATRFTFECVISTFEIFSILTNLLILILLSLPGIALDYLVSDNKSFDLQFVDFSKGLKCRTIYSGGFFAKYPLGIIGEFIGAVVGAMSGVAFALLLTAISLSLIASITISLIVVILALNAICFVIDACSPCDSGLNNVSEENFSQLDDTTAAVMNA